MIRMGLALTILVIVMNGVLLLTDTQGFNDFGAFKDLSSALNQFQDVGAETNIEFQETTFIGSGLDAPAFLGYVKATTTAGIAALKLAFVLLAGSIQVIGLLDPNNLWGILILGPVAAVQIFYFFFLVLTIASAVLGSLRGVG